MDNTILGSDYLYDLTIADSLNFPYQFKGVSKDGTELYLYNPREDSYGMYSAFNFTDADGIKFAQRQHARQMYACGDMLA